MGMLVIWYTDYKGQLHHIKGTKGGQQGDPLEMLSFCLAANPVRCRVMARHPTARAAAFADDGYIHDDLLNALLACADLRSAMQEDLDLDDLKSASQIQGLAGVIGTHLSRH